MVVLPGEEGLRLDHFLRQKTGLSRRQIVTLIRNGLIKVDGRSFQKGRLLVQGQEVKVLSWSVPKKNETALSCKPDVLFERADFVAIDKPSGLHSEEQFSSPEASVQSLLPLLIPGQDLFLLNRLDRLTSGIVLLAKSVEARERYKKLQAQGEVKKIYLALVQGRLQGSWVIKNRILSARGVRVKVLDRKNRDYLRWTWVRPVDFFLETDQTLVIVKIFKGVRHQIRAHLSKLGYPIVGDPLYGEQGEKMYLHHCTLSFSDLTIKSFPCWPGCPELSSLQPLESVWERSR